MSDGNGFCFDHEPLKNCPFCDSDKLSFETYQCSGWIECDECEARGPINNLAEVFLEKSEGNAVEAWNDRLTK